MVCFFLVFAHHQVFEMDVSRRELDKLEFELFHKRTVGSHLSIGRCTFDLARIEDGKQCREELTLENVPTGYNKSRTGGTTLEVVVSFTSRAVADVGSKGKGVDADELWMGWDEESSQVGCFFYFTHTPLLMLVGFDFDIFLIGILALSHVFLVADRRDVPLVLSQQFKHTSLSRTMTRSYRYTSNPKNQTIGILFNWTKTHKDAIAARWHA
jgi:hypothetical protein